MVNTSTAAIDDGQKFRELIHGIQFAMMTTHDQAGLLRSRPMTTQDIQPDGSLLFLTSDRTAIAQELAANPAVLVSYSDPDHHRYVSVNGTATLRHDPKLVGELWKPGYRAWFPKGPEDPSITIVSVEASRAEYWDAPAAPVRLLQFVKALTTGTEARMGEHRTIGL